MPGGPVAADPLVVVSHLPPQAPGGEGQAVYLGHLFVEPRRHAPGLADLTEPEAQAVGLWCTRASRALREVAGADHVYAAVLGDRVPHLHVHLLARYPGTPQEFWGCEPTNGPAQNAAPSPRSRPWSPAFARTWRIACAIRCSVLRRGWPCAGSAALAVV